ncbi:MAG: NADH-quinone oxidoreductase subunit C [Candidatus Latescibacteria bacterium]|nr:NADH-quinone oxidoreductase subunit C [Candidatus Latescibacterota bacterium]
MAKTEIEPIKAIRERFSKEIIKFREKSEKRYYILIEKKDLLEVVNFLFNDLKARYIIETGLDTAEGIEILYHFSFDNLGKVVSLRVLLSPETPEVESISPIVKGAQWIEREIQDILGVKFLNHPDPRRFILADDWPEGVYPYRKR